MKELVYVITDPVGLHARPAGDFVKECQALSCDVRVEKEQKAADAKRLLQVMSLGAKKGDIITLRISGEGEEEACAHMETWLSEHL